MTEEINNLAPITHKNMKINTNKDPLILYDHWTVEEHKKGGKIDWNPEDMELYIPENQRKVYITGHDLRKELGDNVMNANVLDFLLKNTELIPKSWKKNPKGNIQFIYFWGTIYRDSDDGLYVRCLYFDVGRWQADYDCLDDDWDFDYPALRRASRTLNSDTQDSQALSPLPEILTINGMFYKRQ